VNALEQKGRFSTKFLQIYFRDFQNEATSLEQSSLVLPGTSKCVHHNEQVAAACHLSINGIQWKPSDLIGCLARLRLKALEADHIMETRNLLNLLKHLFCFRKDILFE
jgi:hypothetical protein